jgi:hypothetical protein
MGSLITNLHLLVGYRWSWHSWYEQRYICAWVFPCEECASPISFLVRLDTHLGATLHRCQKVSMVPCRCKHAHYLTTTYIFVTCTGPYPHTVAWSVASNQNSHLLASYLPTFIRVSCSLDIACTSCDGHKKEIPNDRSKTIRLLILQLMALKISLTWFREWWWRSSLFSILGSDRGEKQSDILGLKQSEVNALWSELVHISILPLTHLSRF